MQRALAIASDAPPAARARALLLAGDLAWVQGGLARAGELIDASAALWRELADDRGLAKARLTEGFVALVGGDDARAWDCFAGALATLGEPEDGVFAAIALTNLGILAFRRDEITQAKALLEQALARCRAVGFEWGIGDTLEYLGEVARAEGDSASAASRHRESLRAFRAQGDLWGIGGGLVNLAVLAAGQGWYAQVPRLLGAAAAVYDDLGIRSFMLDTFRAQYEAVVAEVRRALGDETADALWRAGQTMSLMRAIAEAEAVAEALVSQPTPAPAATDVEAGARLIPFIARSQRRRGIP